MICELIYECLPDTRLRPGDIFMPEFDVYGDAFFDISVISICADSHYKRASKGPFKGAEIRFHSKKMKYKDLKENFKPLVVESTGGWHPFSLDYLTTVSEHIASRSARVASDVLNELLADCSVRLQRYQGTMLVRRCLGR